MRKVHIRRHRRMLCGLTWTVKREYVVFERDESVTCAGCIKVYETEKMLKKDKKEVDEKVEPKPKKKKATININGKRLVIPDNPTMHQRMKLADLGIKIKAKS